MLCVLSCRSYRLCQYCSRVLGDDDLRPFPMNSESQRKISAGKATTNVDVPVKGGCRKRSGPLKLEGFYLWAVHSLYWRHQKLRSDCDLKARKNGFWPNMGPWKNHVATGQKSPMSSNSNIHSTQILTSLDIEVYGVIYFVLWSILGLSSREMELQKRIAGLLLS